MNCGNARRKTVAGYLTTHSFRKRARSRHDPYSRRQPSRLPCSEYPCPHFEGPHTARYSSRPLRTTTIPLKRHSEIEDFIRNRSGVLRLAHRPIFQHPIQAPLESPSKSTVINRKPASRSVSTSDFRKEASAKRSSDSSGISTRARSSAWSRTRDIPETVVHQKRLSRRDHLEFFLG